MAHRHRMTYVATDGTDLVLELPIEIDEDGRILGAGIGVPPPSIALWRHGVGDIGYRWRGKQEIVEVADDVR